VQIWRGDCFAELAFDLREGAADESVCAFASGFEKGIVMSMIKPEWVQALYPKLREYYLTTHTLTDLSEWQDQADATAHAIPIAVSLPWD